MNLCGSPTASSFGKPCTEWLELIEKMCNEIIGNCTKKEDQLMTYLRHMGEPETKSSDGCPRLRIP
jgi:hypothetical protein